MYELIKESSQYFRNYIFLFTIYKHDIVKEIYNKGN